MDAVHAEFVGGPWDGKRIPLDDPADPAPRIVVSLMLPTEDGAASRSRAVVYHLHPNPDGDGPWLYRFEDPSLQP